MVPQLWFPRDNWGGFKASPNEMRSRLFSLLGLLHLLEIRAMTQGIIGSTLTLHYQPTSNDKNWTEPKKKKKKGIENERHLWSSVATTYIWRRNNFRSLVSVH